MGLAGTKIDRLSRCNWEEFSNVNLSDLSSPEEKYVASTSIEKRKRYGQFFTPYNIAEIMTSWISEKNPNSLLDPAIGTGILVRSAIENISTLNRIIGYDLDERVTEFIPAKYKPLISLKIADFLNSCDDLQVDSVIMNPPYIRHHDILDSNIHEKVSDKCKIRLPKTTNAYVLFSILAIESLRIGGRAAVIIPTEWMNANFGKKFKEYLLKNGYLKQIIYFSNCSEIFDGAITTACILLLEKNNNLVEQVDFTFIESANKDFNYHSVEEINSNFIKSPILCSDLKKVDKWDYLVKNGVKEKIKGYVRLGDFCNSKRGIATGANEFFHLSKVKAKEVGLKPHNLISCIGKANDVAGYVFTNEDLKHLEAQEKKTCLLSISKELSETELKYIEEGEAQNLHSRYLLSKRNPWYSMEVRKIAPIWAAVFGRDELRFIRNESIALNLTTFHGIYPIYDDEDFLFALVSVLNSRIIQESSRSQIRVYGGGLLKFEPKDILEIQIPDLRRVSKKTLSALSSTFKKIINSELDWKHLDELVAQSALEAESKASEFM